MKGFGLNSTALKDRTKRFGVDLVKFVNTLPKGRAADIIGRQLIRSATSVGANYRAACRGRSKAEFIAKLGICIEEADETQYWLEVLSDADLVQAQQVVKLMEEANELTAILTASVKTARKNSHVRRRTA